MGLLFTITDALNARDMPQSLLNHVLICFFTALPHPSNSVVLELRQGSENPFTVISRRAEQLHPITPGTDTPTDERTTTLAFGSSLASAEDATMFAPRNKADLLRLSRHGLFEFFHSGGHSLRNDRVGFLPEKTTQTFLILIFALC